MRTKHLLTAMVLPALFAACTNEDLEVVSNGAETSRAVVKNVVLDFQQGVNSRLAYDGEKYQFEANDQIGAALMDELSKEVTYRDPKHKWSEWFTLVDYIQTNYKFTRDAEGNWETEAKLCEGNYFFAFPYNANLGLRDAYTFTCANQTLENTNRDALLKAYAKNNSFVGYGKVASGSNEGESVAVDMVPVFGSTGFTLKNTGTNTYKIEKIVLNGTAVSATATVTPASPTAVDGVTFDVAKHTGDDTSDKDYDTTKALQSVLTYGDEEADQRIDVAIAAGNSVAPQQSINVIVMSGAGTIDDKDDAVLEIHTDKGLIRGINLNKKHEAVNGSIGNEKVVNVLTDKALPALAAADKIEVTFDDTSLDVPNSMSIYSSDELARFIKWNKNVKDAWLTAVLESDVTITKEMCEDLAASQIKELDVRGNGKKYSVTIAADAPENAMDLFTFINVKEVKVNGTQTVDDADVNVDITINAGATLNALKSIAGNVVNNGTMNVKKDVTVKTLTNAGTLVADAKLAVDRLMNYGTVTNNSELTVKSNSTDTYSHNHGTITNNGTLIGNGMLSNNPKMKCGCDNTDELPAAVIDNYGTAKGIYNNSRVNMKSADAAYNESHASSAGEIENTIMSKYVNKNTKESIIVEVSGETKASEVAAIVKGSGASKLYLSGKLVLDPEKNKDGELQMINVVGQEATMEVIAKGLTITGEGQIAFRQNKSENGDRASLTVAEKTTTIVETGVTVYVNALTVEKDANLKIQKGAVVDNKTLTKTGTVDNYGTLKAQ